MKAGQIMKIKSNGALVQILSVDADTAALVWVCYVADPDMDGMIARGAITKA